MSSLCPTPLLCGALLALACSRPVAPHEDLHDDEKAQAEEAHEAHRVVLGEEQLASAGVRVERAEGGELARHVELPAVVAADADALTHVNPKAPGIVRAIGARLGQEVLPGELLCTIDSVALGGAVAASVRARALVRAGETMLERERELFRVRLETAERVLEGAIALERKVRERERELQEQALSTVRPLLEAEKALQEAELAKERALTELRAERDARLLALEVELVERRIDAEAASNALAALGIDASLLEGEQPPAALLAGTYEIRAPRAGVVVGRHITTGEFVDAQTKLYTLEDLSRVWVLASAFETQLRSVRTGQRGSVRLDAFPGRAFEGEVALVGHEVDVHSRALSVRLELANPGLADWPEPHPLRPGMFGSVDLEVSRERVRVVLPESAIVHGDPGEFVFVRVAPGTFEKRAVELGPPSGELVELRSGLEPGEEVAVAGTFALESALRAGELGEGHGH